MVNKAKVLFVYSIYHEIQTSAVFLVAVRGLVRLYEATFGEPRLTPYPGKMSLANFVGFFKSLIN